MKILYFLFLQYLYVYKCICEHLKRKSRRNSQTRDLTKTDQPISWNEWHNYMLSLHQHNVKDNTSSICWPRPTAKKWNLVDNKQKIVSYLRRHILAFSYPHLYHRFVINKSIVQTIHIYTFRGERKNKVIESKVKYARKAFSPFSCYIFVWK